jgi:hypothetical protein
MDARRGRRKRERMWAENPHCHWCSRKTILAKTDASGRFLLPHADKGLAATLDHLRARHHPGRREPARPDERRIVLACMHCNSTRDAAEQRLHLGEEAVRDTGRQDGRMRLARARANLPKAFYESEHIAENRSGARSSDVDAALCLGEGGLNRIAAPLYALNWLFGPFPQAFSAFSHELSRPIMGVSARSEG